MAMNLDSVTVTKSYLRLITEIDEFKGSWIHWNRMQPEKLRQLRKVAAIQSIGSSTRIEGARLSDREVETLLSNLAGRSFTSRDEEEIAGYAEAMETVFGSFELIPLTENYIKQLHGMLLKYTLKDAYHKGAYKNTPNHVEAFDPDGKSLGIVFTTSSPFDTPFQMNQLIEQTRIKLIEKELHPLLIIGAFIVSFLAIHPFQDGNGRLSRVLTTLLLLQNGYSYVPYLSLESIIEQNKEAYYLALHRTQTTLFSPQPDWEPWLNFFLLTLKKQKDLLKERVSSETDVQNLPALSRKIWELVTERGRLTTGELENLTQAPRGTVKKHLSALLESGYLVRKGKGRGAWYEAN